MCLRAVLAFARINFTGGEFFTWKETFVTPLAAAATRRRWPLRDEGGRYAEEAQLYAAQRLDRKS